MKKKFKLSLVVKRAKIEFKEGLGIGVLGSNVVEFQLPENYSEEMLQLSIREHCEKLIKDIVEVRVETK